MSGRIWLGSLAAIATLIALWVSVDLFLVLVIGALVVWVAVLYDQRDKARNEWGGEVFRVAVWKAKAESLEREAERLHLLLTEADIAVARVPLLRSVPKPRDKMDDDWLELLITRPTGGAN